jgi:hypothetical protein
MLVCRYWLRFLELRWPGARLYHLLPSPMLLRSVYVLIALPLGEYRVIDRSADAKWKLQLAVY